MITFTNDFKVAVEDELVVCGILNDSHKDARKAVQDIIAWNVAVALDPLVSKEAQDLIASGKEQETFEQSRTRFEVKWDSWCDSKLCPYKEAENDYGNNYHKNLAWEYWQVAANVKPPNNP